MQVFLKPQVGSNLAKIAIGQLPFCIGRHEDPFRRYPKQQVHTLSKHHARLFEQAGYLYLVDLSSANGTQCNGLAVGETPVRVRSGDLLSFGRVSYQLSVEEKASTTSRTQGSTLLAKPPNTTARLVLAPNSGTVGLAPMVVRSFPFLVGRHTTWFSRLTETHPQAIACLSQEHALLFVYENKLYVDDLGSTNGTSVDGQRVLGTVEPLATGAALAFGDTGLEYQAFLLEAHEPDPDVLNQHQVQADADAHTLFVDAPTEFIGSLDPTPQFKNTLSWPERWMQGIRSAIRRLSHFSVRL